MEVVNKVFPNREQIEGFMAPGQDGPIYMLNLLTFKEKAEYPDGRDTDLTGAEAYAVYSAEVAGHLATVGGRPMFAAKVERLMLGEVEELWDTAAIAMYPSRKAMMEMMSEHEVPKGCPFATMAGRSSHRLPDDHVEKVAHHLRQALR